jgi:hypothetical protein
MKRRNNTPEYWMSLVEQHLKLGNQFALIPVENLPQEAAIALAERLDVVLEKWDTDYVFHQKMEIKDGKGQVLH